jgi:hypothetical protein
MSPHSLTSSGVPLSVVLPMWSDKVYCSDDNRHNMVKSQNSPSYVLSVDNRVRSESLANAYDRKCVKKRHHAIF